MDRGSPTLSTPPLARSLTPLARTPPLVHPCPRLTTHAPSLVPPTITPPHPLTPHSCPLTHVSSHAPPLPFPPRSNPAQTPAAAIGPRRGQRHGAMGGVQHAPAPQHGLRGERPRRAAFDPVARRAAPPASTRGLLLPRPRLQPGLPRRRHGCAATAAGQLLMASTNRNLSTIMRPC